MVLWQNDPTPVKVRWFRAPDDAKFIGQGNSMSSAAWDELRGLDFPIGEDESKYARDRLKGSNPVGYKGRSFCGRPEVFRSGGVHGIDPPITTDADGSSACCGARGVIGIAGIGLGGGINPVPFPSLTGGVLVGGSATVEVLPEIHATGGVLVGGSLTATSSGSAHGTGGVLVGGSVTFAESDRVYATGGVLVGGVLGASADGSADLLGGVLVGGTTDIVVPVDLPSTGGVLVGGSAGILAAAAAHATGGVLVGGSLTALSSGSAHGTGGVLVGGSLTALSSGSAHGTGGVLVGGSLTIPEVPTLQTVWHDEGTVTNGNLLTYGVPAAQMYQAWSFQNAAANGDTREFPFLMPPGTYTLCILDGLDSNQAKVDIFIDGVKVVSLYDQYNGTTVNNHLQALTTVTLTGSSHILKTVVNTKNSLSSGFFFILTKFFFR